MDSHQQISNDTATFAVQQSEEGLFVQDSTTTKKNFGTKDAFKCSNSYSVDVDPYYYVILGSL